MDVINVTHHGKEFLFNGTAYMSANNSADTLLELETELATIDRLKYTVIFQLEALYDFHKHRGLPENTVSILAGLDIGHCRLVNATAATAQVRKLSNSFYYIEWIQ